MLWMSGSKDTTLLVNHSASYFLLRLFRFLGLVHYDIGWICYVLASAGSTKEALENFKWGPTSRSELYPSIKTVVILLIFRLMQY
jgi:hypothetical protein